VTVTSSQSIYLSRAHLINKEIIILGLFREKPTQFHIGGTQIVAVKRTIVASESVNFDPFCYLAGVNAHAFLKICQPSNSLKFVAHRLVCV